MATTEQHEVGGPPFDPHTAAYLRDPYAALRGLRERGPSHFDPGTGMWFLLSYDSVGAGLAQIVRNRPDGPDRQVNFPANPFAADGAEHTVPRRLIAPSFTNRAVQRFRGLIEQIVDEVLAPKRDGSELRVVEEVGFTLPYRVTCDMLGVPVLDDPSDLREWTWRSLELIDAFASEEQLRANIAAGGRLAEHLRGVIEQKRSDLGDDLLSTVIRAADEGEVIRPHQVVPYVHTLYLAGMHTTVNQLSLSFHALLTHPDQWVLLTSGAVPTDVAVEELLRYEPTAQYFRRSADEDVTLGEVTIPAGAGVVCWIASANRDPAQWGPTADDLDLTRPDARHHLAFGKGPHTCLGSWLARLELEVVLGRVAERFPRTRMAEQELVWSSNVIRGPEELVLELRR
jgi:cytochrome P450